MDATVELIDGRVLNFLNVTHIRRNDGYFEVFLKNDEKTTTHFFPYFNTTYLSVTEEK